MSDKLMIFTHEIFGQIEVYIDENGNPWFHRQE